MSRQQKLHKILQVDQEVLDKVEEGMEKVTGKKGVVKKLEEDVQEKIDASLAQMGISSNATAEEVVEGLTKKVEQHEKELYEYIGISEEDFDFEKVEKVARKLTSEKEGFFLKKEYAEQILRDRPPQKVLEYLGYKDVDELLDKEDVGDVFSSLRFIETNEWMHETFDKAYSGFTAKHFERRPIELRMLGEQWFDVAEKFVAKKHHNVSHLKEFGIIFLNPINQTNPGYFFRDFALFFHYFHEVAFYSKLFEMHSKDKDFAEKLKSFLRGDVPEKNKTAPGEWLIVQRYLWKDDPNDKRIHLPRVNPEALHWHKGEQDLVKFGRNNIEIGLDFWDNLDWVAEYFTNKNGEEELVSFDMEDSAMSYADKTQNFNYHQQEALWNELFRRYVGKEERDKLIIENFEKGYIQL